MFHHHVTSCFVVCPRKKKMDRHIITAFLALLLTLISVYSLACKSIVLQSAYFLCKRRKLTYLALILTLRRRLIHQRRLNRSRLRALLLSPAHGSDYCLCYLVWTMSKVLPYAIMYEQFWPGVWQCDLYACGTCPDLL